MLLLAGAAAMALSACATNHTSSLAQADFSGATAQDKATVLAQLAGRYKSNPRDKGTIIYYAAALVIVSVLMVWGLLTRKAADLHVVRDRNPLFVRLHDGSIRNGYTLQVSNRTFEPKVYGVTFDGVRGAVLKTPGEPAARDHIEVAVEPDSVRAVRVFVSAPRPDEAMAHGAFALSAGGKTETVKTVFISDAPQ